jgi:hypothetical protein
MPGKVRQQIQRGEKARKERLVLLAQQVRPVVAALRRLRLAQAAGVGADQVLAAVELVAAEVALAEVAAALAVEAGVTEAEWAAAVLAAEK